MREERWFISYRVEKDHKNVITDVTPAHWVLMKRIRSRKEVIILYAEQISLALSSELRHMAGIKFDNFGEEELC